MRPLRFCLFLPALLLTLFVAGAFAIEQPSASVPTFRKTTRMVQVDVMVRDSHGQHMRNLTRDDFVLKDDGHVQQISSFAVEHGPDIEPAAKTVAGVAGLHQYSNVHSGGAIATVILLDLLNTPTDNQVDAKKRLIAAFQQKKMIAPTA